jgi:AAA ATPase domain
MLLQTTPATTLAQIPRTLHPEALETPEELQAFYKTEIENVRGIDRTGQMKICLEDAHAAQLPFKAFLLGHPGVGKTTEVNKLLLELEKQFRPLRLSVLSELNPGTLRYYDVLLLILIRLVFEVSRAPVIGFEDTDLPKMLADVRDHLAKRWTKHLQVDAAEFGAGAGFNIPFLKLFGNIKQGRTRERGSEEYELSLVSELTDLMNTVLQECNRLLRKHQQGREWVIVLEDLEKIGLSPTALKELFMGLRPSLQSLDGHFIVIIPIWLKYSKDADICLPPNFESFVIPDIAVYQQSHRRDEETIAALKAVVTARVSESLFATGVLERFCIASGGNLRDLFLMIRNAMLSARLRYADVISVHDADGAIASLRNDYRNSLGSTGEDDAETPLTEKLDRLVAIYQRKDPSVEVPDPVLYLLLRKRCALQYNGAGWIGVHPLIVDLLIDFARLEPQSPGGSRL